MKKLIFFVILNFCNYFLKGTRFFNLKRSLFNFIGIKVGKGTKIVGPLNISRNLKLEIGSGNWIGTNLTIHGNGKLIIGKNNDIAPEVTILTGSHEIGDKNRRAGKGKSFEYYIGNGNWIGAKSTLINGCNIGNGVIIGTCSLVNNDTDDNSIYLGIPAKKYKMLEN